MQCLLDKVTTRYLLQGLRKLGEQQTPPKEELAALDFFTTSVRLKNRLYIAPPTLNVLLQLKQTPRYAKLIQFVLERTQVAQPTRYYKRWARRLRAFGFTREDAAILALATFSSNALESTLGMDYVVTFDQPMINHWQEQQINIQVKLAVMCVDIPTPYNKVRTPQVVVPQAIIR